MSRPITGATSTEPPTDRRRCALAELQLLGHVDVAVEVAGSRFQRVRVAQHAIQDYFPAVWRMMRATVIGEEPR